MNNRSRALAKIDTHEKCPCCKSNVYSRDWSEEYRGVVETHTKCDECSYLFHYAYGNTELGIGNKSFYFTFSSEPEEVEKIFKKFDTAVKRFRRNKGRN